MKFFLIKVGFWNVHGLHTKLDSATAFFLFLNTLDIFCLAETWIEDNYDTLIFSALFSNFNLSWTFATRIATRGRAMGGLLIGYKKNLTNWKFDSFNGIVFMRNISNGLLFLPTYFPPNNWAKAFDDYNNFFLNFDLHEILLLGDFNARIAQSDTASYHINLSNKKSK